MLLVIISVILQRLFEAIGLGLNVFGLSRGRIGLIGRILA